MLHLNKNLVFILLPFSSFFLGYLICNILIGNKTYTTPNLTGLSIYEAIKLTSPHQMNIRILSEKESSDIPAGTILSQKPSPGRIIKTHQSIFVITTKSPKEVITPSVLQQPHNTVEKHCHDLNLKIKTYMIEYPAPYNSCIAQIPQAGETAHDKKMTAYFAKDKQDIYIMPDFNNQLLSNVLETLQEHTDKTTIYHRTQKLKPPYPDNMKITAQKPLAGSLVSLQTPLNIQLQVE